jgi:hypothetical protein
MTRAHYAHSGVKGVALLTVGDWSHNVVISTHPSNEFWRLPYGDRTMVDVTVGFMEKHGAPQDLIESFLHHVEEEEFLV